MLTDGRPYRRAAGNVRSGPPLPIKSVPDLILYLLASFRQGQEAVSFDSNQCVFDLALSIKANRRVGRNGISSIWIPNGSSAFSTADMIAAPAGTTPTSPTPLTPNGLSGDGKSSGWISI